MHFFQIQQILINTVTLASRSREEWHRKRIFSRGNLRRNQSLPIVTAKFLTLAKVVSFPSSFFFCVNIFASAWTFVVICYCFSTGKRFIKPSKVTKDMDADRVSPFCLSLILTRFIPPFWGGGGVVSIFSSALDSSCWGCWATNYGSNYLFCNWF